MVFMGNCVYHVNRQMRYLLFNGQNPYVESYLGVNLPIVLQLIRSISHSVTLYQCQH